MDDALALDPLTSLLPLDRPFTRGTAAASGVSRRALERMLASGSVERLLRGVYAASPAPDTPSFRALAAGLAAGHGAVVVDRTAGWVHGLDRSLLGLRDEPVPLDVVRRAPRSGRLSRHLVARDVHGVEGAAVTTPLRTALDLGRLLPEGRALGALDALLAVGSFAHGELLAELPRMAGAPGIAQLRRLAPLADARSGGPAESVLRLAWLGARLPTPVPAVTVAAGVRLVRLALAVDRRQFGVVLAGQVGAEDLVALEGAGWRVVVLHRNRVLHGDQAGWIRHLEREFHQQLLAQAG